MRKKDYSPCKYGEKKGRDEGMHESSDMKVLCKGLARSYAIVIVQQIPSLYFITIMYSSAVFQKNFPIVSPQEDPSAAKYRIVAFSMLVLFAKLVYDGVVNPVTKILISFLNDKSKDPDINPMAP